MKLQKNDRCNRYALISFHYLQPNAKKTRKNEPYSLRFEKCYFNFLFYYERPYFLGHHCPILDPTDTCILIFSILSLQPDVIKLEKLIYGTDMKIQYGF